MRKHAISVLTVAALVLSACGASKPTPEIPTVNTIITRYVSALGGRAAISDLTSRTSKGTLEIVGQVGQGTALSFAKAPNKYLSIITIPGVGELRRAFDGNAGWVKQLNDPPQDLKGADQDFARRNAEFYESVKLMQVYPNLVLKGQEDINGHPAYLLESDLGGGSFVRMYFDVSSGLRVRTDEDTSTTQGRDLIQSYTQDYRDVQGVKYPFTVRQVHGSSTVIVHLSEILVNQPIDDAKFTKPAK